MIYIYLYFVYLDINCKYLHRKFEIFNIMVKNKLLLLCGNAPL